MQAVQQPGHWGRVRPPGGALCVVVEHPISVVMLSRCPQSRHNPRRSQCPQTGGFQCGIVAKQWVFQVRAVQFQYLITVVAQHFPHPVCPATIQCFELCPSAGKSEPDKLSNKVARWGRYLRQGDHQSVNESGIALVSLVVNRRSSSCSHRSDYSCWHHLSASERQQHCISADLRLQNLIIR